MNDVVRQIREVAAACQGQIASEARLGADLGLSSLDFVRLAAALQRLHGNGRPIPFQRLFVADDGSLVQDVHVSRLVDFLHEHLQCDVPA
jgi:hypothetical protein